MTEPTHPIARSDAAVRILEHTLVDVGDLLGADTFSLDGREITFTRRARPNRAPQRWSGSLGDWLVPDGTGFWRVVSDAEQVTPAALGRTEVQRAGRPG